MKVSINPITQEVCQIPSVLNDDQNIDNFLNHNRGKKVVVVQGLGFVGAVMSLVCANSLTEEYAVIGVDLAEKESYWKIKVVHPKFLKVFLYLLICIY